MILEALKKPGLGKLDEKRKSRDFRPWGAFKLMFGESVFRESGSNEEFQVKSFFAGFL